MTFRVSTIRPIFTTLKASQKQFKSAYTINSRCLQLLMFSLHQENCQIESCTMTGRCYVCDCKKNNQQQSQRYFFYHVSQARWGNLSAQLKKADVVGLDKPILGFNLGDELGYACYPSDDVNTASEAVRHSYPFGKAIIWYNEEARMLEPNPVKDSCGNS